MENKAEKSKVVALKRPVERLSEVLDRHRGERHLVVMRGFPDPDSIGSAMAHAFLCLQFEIEATVLYFDDISHAENRALVKRLAIEMVRYKEGMDLSPYSAMALVDSQNVTLPNEFLDFPCVSIVDHHKLQVEPNAEFVDIREDSGSTCSIYAEYLAEGIVPLDRENPALARLSSALSYGIRSDTDNFLFARELDFRAAAFLSPYADHELLQAISKQNVSPKTMEITQKAYANKVIADTFLVSGVRYVREEDRDSIGQAADYLLGREGIDTVIVYGIVAGQFVDGSLRTNSSVVDPDRFLKELLGSDSHGAFYGGGRTEKGAFKIDLGVFNHCPDRDLLWGMVKSTIENLFLAKVGHQPAEPVISQGQKAPS